MIYCSSGKPLAMWLLQFDPFYGKRGEARQKLLQIELWGAAAEHKHIIGKGDRL